MALIRTKGVGPATFAKLLDQMPDPMAIFGQPTQLVGINTELRDALLHPDWQQVVEDLQWLDKPDRHIVTLDDDRYPTLLREIADPPPLLFVQGEVSCLQDWQLAIVGSRHPSAGGRDNAFEFARYLAGGGLHICSGLADGIDAAAHQGALAAAGKTIAVVGTGLDRVYPAKNRDLAHQIAAQGAIISEFPPGTPPRAENFPRRNRLISGLSLGTLIVEAAVRSGSLITARMAMEQGREVFAIPGSIHNPLARGCHQLIREGAKLVETATDILDELGAIAEFAQQSPVETRSADMANAVETDDEYQMLFEHLGFDPISIDMLVARSGLTAEAVSSMLLLLELQGRVSSLPGGKYQRTGA
ncbi:Rossmann fold nucleotide-binding protein Smf possibly involved in DNA uptake [Methylophaga frappieri]|uniref:Rossmann fold nucleotide-binding protein Smf possibly involved in DNA uptake n=1 Tax=Methylophaga frappieri (strain ATCC BAA-2434 / DSM 25690 / JAM7) TaxID=754477 RepID=I1YJI5_METFJ|nr:DNA-processing protein DprA [Methylophaga frappieri]AFJ03078.1 Rossmann fold nucleotide-binding protein Smf possibly involved in DNA uptake [Methylophaga frappieri]